MDSKLTLQFTLGEILINQLELSETIYLSNKDQLSHERLGEIMVFIQYLQPKALISGINEMNWINENKKSAFSMKADSSLYDDQLKLFTSRSNMKVIGHYGIETYVYQSFLPVVFSRLENFLTELPSEVFRMKGRCYIPFSQELYSLSQVGSSIQVDATNMCSAKSINVLTELLFIGSKMKLEEIEMMLNDCLEIKYENGIAY
ncbi:GTP-binding protein [Bacillus solitudinis]|uniref:GTP-binding protein n=1 Tax=Bacillus solitudinis TaxID=2014074 RepID=UPI0012FD9F12|nr:GTP-binding protein [Bacillus solitudinis]